MKKNLTSVMAAVLFAGGFGMAGWIGGSWNSRTIAEFQKNQQAELQKKIQDQAKELEALARENSRLAGELARRPQSAGVASSGAVFRGIA